MNIGFNAQIVSRTNAGVANYARHLVEHVTKLTSPHVFYVFGTSEYLQTLQSDNIQKVATDSLGEGSWKRILWEQSTLPVKIKQLGLDLMLYPDHVSSLFFHSCASIITVHDLAFLSRPDTFSSSRRIYKSAAMKRSARIADRIVAVSEFTKNECVNLLDIPEEKISVVHNGIDALFYKIENEQQLSAGRAAAKITKRFILFVGTLEPRKNIIKLIEAFAVLKGQQRIEQELVIVGGKGWLEQGIHEAIRRHFLQNDVRILGYVSQQELLILYNLADVFVYPSLYEGFGFPPLEAMACGCPVVTSNRSSLPEIVGDAAVLVNPDSVDDIATGILRVASDQQLSNELRRKGFQRIRHFSWDRTAREIMGIFEILKKK